MSKITQITDENLSEVIDMVSEAFQYPAGEKISRDFPLFFASENAPHLFAIFESVDKEKILASHAGTYTVNLVSDKEAIKVGGIGEE